MNKIMKRILSVTLVAIMLVSVAPLNSFAVDDNSSVDIEGNTLDIDSQNTLGDIIIEEMEKQEEQTETNFGVIGVSVSSKSVTVELTNSAACRVAVALYNDDTGVMDDYILKSVDANAGEVKASFNLTAMPEFYLLRAFLIGENAEALCEAYTYIEKTHNYIEAQSKTVDDFEGDIIINFDDSKDNNFAVAPENSVEVNPSDGHNVLSDFDDEAGTYTFTNIDEKISSLSVGQVLCYGDDVQNILVLKVTAVKINGTTAVITADTDATISDLFRFVKIDTQSNKKGDDKTVDMTDVEDGITYEGMETYNAGEIETSSVDIDYSSTLSCPIWKINKKYKADTDYVDADVDFKFNVKAAISYSFKLYFDLDWEWRIDIWNAPEGYFYFENSYSFSVKGSGSVSGSLSAELYLGKVNFETPVGISLGIEFTLCVSFSASVTLDAVKISFKLGYRIESDKDIKSLCSLPKVELIPALKSAVEVSIGLKTQPVVGLIKIVELRVEPEFGLSASVSMFDVDIKEVITGKEETEQHDCKLCFEGELSAYVKADIVGFLLFNDIRRAEIRQKMPPQVLSCYL